jgi:hypothetical protein
MKKKRGKKMKVSSSKKKKKFFPEEHYPLVALFVLTLFCITLALSSINSSMTGNAILPDDSTNSFLDRSPPSGISDIANAFLNVGNTWKDIIISVIVLLIIFVGIYDILELTTIFSNWWVILIISAGLSIIAALTNIVRNITYWLLSFAAGLGALGIVIEIVISIIIFVGLSIGSPVIARWAARRKAQAVQIRAIKKGSEVSGAITGLKEIWTNLKK